MSNERIGIVMNRLLTDEVFRLRFEFDRVATLGELQAEGVDLTPNELDLFIESDVDIWTRTNRRERWMH